MTRSLFGLGRRRTPFFKSLLSRLVFLLDSFLDSLSCFFIHSEDYTDLIATTDKPVRAHTNIADSPVKFQVGRRTLLLHASQRLGENEKLNLASGNHLNQTVSID